MPIVSWAQNREDVVLDRVFRGVERGFYVDVGAGDPVEESVTKAFYDRGWRGVNIEPLAACQARLAELRPEDVNLAVAVGAEPGTATFYEVPGTGLSTLDEACAAEARARGFDCRPSTVEVRRLADILDEVRPAEIHFLKVDVEGAEREVLLGADLGRWRPWVIVVEAIAPMGSLEEASPRATHEAWEPLVVSAGYRFALFDGLNRFYVAEEHGELAEWLSFPACVLDGDVPSEVVRLREALERSESERKRAEAALAAERTAFDRLKGETLLERRALEEARGDVARLEAELAAERDAFDRLEGEAALDRRALEEARGEVARLEAELAAERDAFDRLKGETLLEREELMRENLALRADADGYFRMLDSVLSSTSWRITAPVRWTKDEVVRPLATRLRKRHPTIAEILVREERPDEAKPLTDEPERVQELVELFDWFVAHRSAASSDSGSGQWRDVG